MKKLAKPILLAAVIMAFCAMPGHRRQKSRRGSTIIRMRPVVPRRSRTQEKPIFSDLGSGLEVAGITPHLALWSLWGGNPPTGPRQGSHAITNDIFAGADFDLQQMLNIPDATFPLEYTFFRKGLN